MPDHRPRPEFRSALGEWFVSELTSASTSAASERMPSTPPRMVVPESTAEPESTTTSRRWVGYAAAVLVVGGLLVPLLTRDRTADPDQARSVTELLGVVDPLRDVDSVCEQLAAAVPRLTGGASRTAVADAVQAFVATLDDLVLQLDQISAAAGALPEDARARLRAIRDRVAQLPSLTGSTVLDRSVFDAEVGHIGILLLDWGSSMSSLGAARCDSLPTFREQS